MMRHMKFGVFTVSMHEYDFAKTVEVLKKIGYDGVEWRVAALPPDNRTFSTIDVMKADEYAPMIKDICLAAGIEIFGLSTYLQLWDTEDIERVMKAASMMGCRNVRISPPLYEETISYWELFNKARTSLDIVQQMAKKYNVKAVLEIHPRTIIPSASAAYRLVEGYDPNNIGLIFDSGNLVYEGFENYKMIFELIGSYLAHVHIKNSMWQLESISDDGAEIWKPAAASFNKGFADLKRVMQMLKEAGYDDTVSIEDFSAERSTYDKLKFDLEFLKKITM